MISLAERLGSHAGAYCGVEGFYLGPTALIELQNGIYRVRPPEEIAVLVAAAYGSPPDNAKLTPRLHAIAADLQRSAIGQAMVSAVLLGFGEMSEEGMRSVAEAEALLKHNFNPLEPRNRIGWWERDGEANSIIPVRAERLSHPARLGEPTQR